MRVAGRDLSAFCQRADTCMLTAPSASLLTPKKLHGRGAPRGFFHIINAPLFQSGRGPGELGPVVLAAGAALTAGCRWSDAEKNPLLGNDTLSF